MGIACVNPRRISKVSIRKISTVSSKKLNHTKLDKSFDAPYAIVEDKVKTKEDDEFLLSSLSKNKVFNNLSEEQLDSVIRNMRYYILESGEIVFVQGSPGSVFFVVANGRLEVLVEGVLVNELSTSDCFGEVALMHDSKRSATIKTISSTRLWGVDRKTFLGTLDHLNANDYAENKNLIMNIPSFRMLNNVQLESLITSSSISVYGPGQDIVIQGETGTLLYIIKQGSVICTENGRQTRNLEKGEYFGEKALFSQTSLRSATITATEYVKCLSICRDALTALLGSSIQGLAYKNSARIAFDKNSYLQILNRTQYEKILNLLKITEFTKGEKAIQQGVHKNGQIFVIVKGELTNKLGEIWFKEYDVIGIEEVIQDIDSCYELDYYCKENVDVGVISASGFFEAIEGDYERATRNNESIKTLKNVETFRTLTEEEFESLVRVLKLATFQKDSIIFSQNDHAESMYLIKSGQVDIIVNGQVVRSLRNHNFFGERALLTDYIRTATAKCKTEVVCWELSVSDFNCILNKNFRDLLRKRIELRDDKIKLSKLQFVKQIGSGTYGNVFLVVHKTSKTHYALKTVSRSMIQAYEIHENLLQERRCMLQTDHMLVNKFVKTFKDADRLYFLCEYINGVTLYEVQSKFKKLSIIEVKFYAACFFLMIEHLHARDIVFRALNPCDIMIDNEGYPKLIDFGCAKIIKGRTFTVVNTKYHYLAPEIIKAHGHHLTADYWSLGVLIFELIYGELPFGEEETDPYSVYESILRGKFTYPKGSDNKDKVKDLINQLINKNPENRLVGGFDAIRAHPWFISINWEKLLKRSLPTSYKPLLKNVEKEVELLLKSKKVLKEVIADVEKNQIVPKRRAYERYPMDWDDEFST